MMALAAVLNYTNAIQFSSYDEIWDWRDGYTVLTQAQSDVLKSYLVNWTASGADKIKESQAQYDAERDSYNSKRDQEQTTLDQYLHSKDVYCASEGTQAGELIQPMWTALPGAVGHLMNIPGLNKT